MALSLEPETETSREKGQELLTVSTYSLHCSSFLGVPHIGSLIYNWLSQQRNSNDSNILALIIRMGFWGSLYYTYDEEPPKTVFTKPQSRASLSRSIFV